MQILSSDHQILEVTSHIMRRQWKNSCFTSEYKKSIHMCMFFLLSTPVPVLPSNPPPPPPYSRPSHYAHTHPPPIHYPPTPKILQPSTTQCKLTAVRNMTWPLAFRQLISSVEQDLGQRGRKWKYSSPYIYYSNGVFQAYPFG